MTLAMAWRWMVAGNALLTGSTHSTDFAGANNSSIGGSPFVAKVSSVGRSRLDDVPSWGVLGEISSMTQAMASQ